MRDDYMERRVTPPKRVTSPTWGPHLHVKQALSLHSTTRNLVVLSCIQDEPLRRHFHMATITFSMLKNKMRDFS